MSTLLKIKPYTPTHPERVLRLMERLNARYRWGRKLMRVFALAWQDCAVCNSTTPQN